MNHIRYSCTGLGHPYTTHSMVAAFAFTRNVSTTACDGYGCSDPECSEHCLDDPDLEAELEAMADHPFLISSPDMARQVAAFRIRLLELA